MSMEEGRSQGVGEVSAAHHNPLPFKGHPLLLQRGEAIWLRAFGTHSEHMDGDSAHFLIQGRPRHHLVTEAIRCDGYDAPELWGKNRDPRGEAARDALASLVVNRPAMLLLQDGIRTVNRYPARVIAYASGEGADALWVDVARRMHLLGHLKDTSAPMPERVIWPFNGKVID